MICRYTIYIYIYIHIHMYPRKWVRNGLQWHLLRLSFLIVHGPDAWNDRGGDERYERWNVWWFYPRKWWFCHVLPTKRRVSPTEMLGFNQQTLRFHEHFDLSNRHWDFNKQKGRFNQKVLKFDIIQLYPTIGICWGFGFVQKSPAVLMESMRF